MKVHIIAVHGIGEGERSGFSQPLRERVMAELERMAPEVAAGIRQRPQDHVWREVVWDFRLPNEALFRRLYPCGDPMPWWARRLLRCLGCPTYREFAFYHVGDIFGYYAQRDCVLAMIRETAADIVREHQERPGGPSSAYLVLVGHSMGSVVAFDFLHEAQREPGKDGKQRASGAELRIDTGVATREERQPLGGLVAAGLFTLGSPLALFSLLPGDEAHHYRGCRGEGGKPFDLHPRGRWYNFYDEEDVVSFPLQGIFGELVEDVRVDNCRLPMAGVLFSHSGYWRNAEVARRLACLVRDLEGGREYAIP